MATKTARTAAPAAPISLAAAEDGTYTAAQLSAIAGKLMEHTIKTFGKYFIVPEAPTTKTSAAAEKVVALLKTGRFLGVTEPVAELLSILLETDITSQVAATASGGSIPTTAFKTGAFLVPVAKAESHNYPLESPAMVRNHGASQLLREDGTTGNSITQTITNLRLPTLAEIEKFVNANINTITDYIVFV